MNCAAIVRKTSAWGIWTEKVCLSKKKSGVHRLQVHTLNCKHTYLFPKKRWCWGCASQSIKFPLEWIITDTAHIRGFGVWRSSLCCFVRSSGPTRVRSYVPQIGFYSLHINRLLPRHQTNFSSYQLHSHYRQLLWHIWGWISGQIPSVENQKSLTVTRTP